MKIGILTLPLGHNYGGLLQNWALQQVLGTFGHESVTIDLRKHHSTHSLFEFILWKQLFAMIFSGFRYRPFSPDPNLSNPIYKHLREFKIRHLRTTTPLFSLLDKHEMLSGFDAFIVGSDQVWRPEYSPDIKAYFLNFCHGSEKFVKVAYAASFGSRTVRYEDSGIQKECSMLLQEFDGVSVREVSAIKQSNQLFGIEPRLVLDPVLLLEAEAYLKLIGPSSEKICSEDFIAGYVLDSGTKKMTVLANVSRLLGLQVRDLKPISRKGFVGKVKALHNPMESPVQWLRNISQSNFIVTDSFHGMCFSIIFKRPFIVIGNKNRGLDRFESLLGLLGLENRLVSETTSEEIINELLLKEIDWRRISKKVNELKVESRKFLEDSLNCYP